MAKGTLKSKKTKNNLPLRLNILFVSVFIAFAILIGRLGYVQIVDGAYYKSQVQSSKSQSAKIDSARGKIVDINGTVLADNHGESAVVYIRHLGIDGYKNLEIARKLSKLIKMDNDVLDRVTLRDKKEYYVLSNFDKLQDAYDKFMSSKEQKSFNKNDTKEYRALIDKIPEHVLPEFSDQDMQILAILHQFNQASNLSPYIVKQGLTNEELAKVGESLDEFYGTIRTDVASTRVYKDGKNSPFYIGDISMVPAEQVDNYLANGYSRNAQVGTSYLEKQYESYLRGIPTTLTFDTKKGTPVGDPVITEGRRGYDVQLTIDYRLQQKVNQILMDNIKNARAMSLNKEAYGAYAVVMNPKTGAILAMGGQKYNKATGQYIDDANSTINAQFQMGSAVKGATELIGFQHDAVPEHFYDMRIHYSNSKKTFKSWEQGGLGQLTPEKALEGSSNIFMAKIASNMAGIHLDPSGSEYVASGTTGPRFQQAFFDMRNGYSQFGLGAKTGIDLPNEGTGYKGPMPPNYGLIHQFAIGQYDTYTPLQMVQYVSTIANGGYRMQPHLLDSVHAPGNDPNKLGPEIYKFEPRVINTINNTKEELDRVHEGLYLVTHGPRGTARRIIGAPANDKYKIAGKTGTAQLAGTEGVPSKDTKLYNETFISYAPYDDPEIAVSVVVPRVRTGHQNQQIALDIIKAYDDLYHYTDRNK